MPVEHVLVGDHLWRTLHLNVFFAERLPATRESTDWSKALQILVSYRLISLGSVPKGEPDNPRHSRGMVATSAVV